MCSEMDTNERLIFTQKNSDRALVSGPSSTATYIKCTLFAKLRAAFFTISLQNVKKQCFLLSFEFTRDSNTDSFTSWRFIQKDYFHSITSLLLCTVNELQGHEDAKLRASDYSWSDFSSMPFLMLSAAEYHLLKAELRHQSFELHCHALELRHQSLETTSFRIFQISLPFIRTTPAVTRTTSPAPQTTSPVTRTTSFWSLQLWSPVI